MSSKTSAPEKSPVHIVLIGLPGSGKTITGSAIAQALQLPFIDLDQEVERLTQKSISEIFSYVGERSFRSLETQVSHYVAHSSPPSVIATGGGWAANFESVAHLRPISRIIYLRVSPTEALRRMDGSLTTRPLLSGPTPIARLEQLYADRQGFYEEIADLTVDTEAFGQDQLVTTIVRHFSE